MNKLLEANRKNPSAVADWYCTLVNSRGYEVAYNFSDLSLLDKYCENILWNMDSSSEEYFKERCAFTAYIGEMLVKNCGAKWSGDFDLYEYLGNYYTSFIEFPNGFRISPERFVGPRLKNKFESPSIEESVVLICNKGKESLK